MRRRTDAVPVAVRASAIHVGSIAALNCSKLAGRSPAPTATAHDLGAQVETFDEECQVSRPATDVQDMVTRLDVRLIEQLAVRRLATDQLGEPIVQRKQPVVASGGNVRPRSFGCSGGHAGFLAGNHAEMNPARDA